MTSRSVAIGQAQPAATSSACRRERTPSSDPTRTIPPNGPAANDSGGRSTAGSERPSPRARRRAAGRPARPRRRGPGPAGTTARAAISAGRGRRRLPAPRRPLRRAARRRRAAPTAWSRRRASSRRRARPRRGRRAPGPIHRSHRASTMRLTSSGGWDSWREEGEAASSQAPLSGAYPGALHRGNGAARSAARPRQARRLGRRVGKAEVSASERSPSAWHAGRHDAAVSPWHCHQRRVVAKPVRSRHSPATVNAPPRAQSPVADHTVHARTFERKVGRTRASHRLDAPPSTMPEARGSRFVADPSDRIPSRRLPPCSRPCPPVPRRRPAGSWPRSRRSSSSWPPAAAAPALAGAPAAPAVVATAAPTATPLPTPSPTPAPAFPATLTDDEGTAVTLAAEPQKIVSLTPAVDRDPVRPRRRRPGRRDRRRAATTRPRPQPLPDVATFGDRRRREDRQPRPRPRHRRRRRVHPGRRDRQAPLAQDPGPGRLRAIDRRRLQGHRARRRPRSAQPTRPTR